MTDRRLLNEIPFPFKGHKLQIHETVDAAGSRMWSLTVRTRHGLYVTDRQCLPHHAMRQMAELLAENTGEQ